MAKFVPRGKLLVELALCKPNKSFLTYKKEEYIENEGERLATSTLEKEKKKPMRYRIVESDEEGSPFSDLEHVNDFEELNLPVPIPNLPPVPREASSTLQHRQLQFMYLTKIVNMVSGLMVISKRKVQTLTLILL